MIEITRGTTPTVELTVDTDLTGYTCYLSFGKAKKEVFTVTDHTTTVSTDSTTNETTSVVSFDLSLANTLKLSKGTTYMQLRAIKDNDAVATEMMEVSVLDIIKDGEIEDVD